MTRKIEEIVPLGYEETRRGWKRKEKRKKRNRGGFRKKEVEIEELPEEEEEHGDGELISSKVNE